MGTVTCEALDEAEGLELSGRAAPRLGTSVEDVVQDADVLVDFSTPSAAPAHVRTALRAGVHAVVGTTGFDVEALRAETAELPGPGANCLVAPNFAIGAVLMMTHVARIAAHMPRCSIVERHNPDKLDAPSGTARRTAELVVEVGGSVESPIHSVRLPGLVAHQEVIFGGPGQTLTLRHDSTDRRSFMPGVLLAVRRIGALPRRFTVGLEHLV
jgi:4-hydroxy-tetrahydrodipicolinate reductase